MYKIEQALMSARIRPLLGRLHNVQMRQLHAHHSELGQMRGLQLRLSNKGIIRGIYPYHLLPCRTVAIGR